MLLSIHGYKNYLVKTFDQISNIIIALSLLGRCGFFPADPADYVDAYRARKKAENRLRYQEKAADQEKVEEEQNPA